MAIDDTDLDVVVGKVESPNMSRRFGLVQQAASSPAKQLRHDLIAQGWDGQNKVTVISDGEPALPNLVRRAAQSPVTPILDWWHISMRVKHIENAVRGLLQSKGFSGLPLHFARPARTLRWYLWRVKVMTAATILKVLQIGCDRLRTETRELREAAKRVRARCQNLYSYLANNFDALVDYGHRHRNGLGREDGPQPSLEEAARALGASQWRVVREVIIPALIASGAIAFATAMAA